MKLATAKEILEINVKKYQEPRGTLYLMLIDEDEDKFYFEVCDIPDGVKPDNGSAPKYAISPPWYVDKRTREVNINWGMPE